MLAVISHPPHQGWMLQGPDRVHIRGRRNPQREAGTHVMAFPISACGP